MPPEGGFQPCLHCLFLLSAPSSWGVDSEGIGTTLCNAFVVRSCFCAKEASEEVGVVEVKITALKQPVQACSISDKETLCMPVRSGL